ncbi:aspartate carbamoyltransferase [Candidatus Bathyarchaeota archaeon]|nr:aspartate carbamoyltransferase [Candidatus Bathyarchaeota archaeon]
MKFEGRDIVSIRDFSRDEIEYIMDTTRLMEPLTKRGSTMLQGRTLATLFFEPSTRTRMSFESAMQKLGGNCISIAEARTSSVEKGESLADTVRTVENYADLLVIRHPLDGSARMAAEIASVPVINAGSGAEEHPTQALLDLYTIQREVGRIDGLNIAFIGDLRYGRTVHSLAYALALYDTTIHFISPESLRVRGEVIDEVGQKVKITEGRELNDVLSRIDVLYVTRIQKERIPDPEEYEKVKGIYRITTDTLRNAKSNMIVMHPLPRVDEIAPEVDMTPNAKYFKQMWYGLVTRMALLALCFGAVE